MTTYEKKGCLSLLYGTLFGDSRNTVRHPIYEDQLSEDFPEAPQPPTYEYRLKKSLLTPAELEFFWILTTTVNGRAMICPQVRMADIFSGTQWGYASLNRIAQRSVDFLLCDPTTMKPVAAIELDDSSHQRENRQARDIEVDAIFQSARLPLLHQPVQRSYDVRELATLLAAVLPPAPHSVPQPSPQAAKPYSALLTSAPTNGTSPVCPKCGIPMVERTVSKGPNQGRKFYGCRNYPNCREVIAYST
ncbi:MAG TPA: DUF2726 domain-containing protein [Candidatus Limnocylindrales bacterium]|nr:DUF2726 domain-containing protein [Candidatus Limnocylindrales bacterium]